MTDHVSERELFEACLNETGPARERLIEEARRRDPKVAERVRRLLRAHEAASSMPILDGEMPIAPPPKLRGYEILRAIGEGGMGVVYEAEQLVPVRRRVAIKVVRAGLNSEKIAQRFAAERQALAAMNHPGIAQIFEAGATSDGRPYFVMELIEGLPLTRFCEERHLSLHARVELMIEICAALEHAHQKGVIHRDLKPSNILVAMRDGKPAPKIIDFGIAKAVDESGATIELLGTPDYMSPEQAAGGDLDTRTDIFSAGVLLYQLLCGRLPLERGSGGLPEFLKRLTDPDVEVPLPSRQADKDVARELTGDLDWIALKAIRRNRSERYPTASALAEDLTRYLESEPVHARPPSFTYRAARFAKRHQPLIAAAGFAVLAVIVGVAGLAGGLREAGKQAERARAAESDARTRLRSALIEQARALRSSETVGRRHRSLELLRQAAGIAPGADIEDEAVASLMLTDLRPGVRWPGPARFTTRTFSRSLQLQAVGIRGGDIQLLRGVPGVPYCRLPGGGHETWSMRFSPDERVLAARYDLRGPETELVVWDTSTCREVRRFPGRHVAQSFDFASGGAQLISGTRDGVVHRYDLATGAEIHRYQAVREIRDVKVSPDGRSVALTSVQNGVVEIRDLDSGKLRTSLTDGGTGFFRASWSSDGRVLLIGGDDSVARLANASGGWVRRLAGHEAEVVDSMIHPYAPLAITYAWDETMRLWNTATGELLLVEPKEPIGFSPDGRLLAFADGSELGVMDVLHGGAAFTLYGHVTKGPRAISMNGTEGQLASGGTDGAILWNLAEGRKTAELDAGNVRDLYLLGNDELITCGDRGLLHWRGARSHVVVADHCWEMGLDPASGEAISWHNENRLHRYSTRDGSAAALSTPYPNLTRPALSARAGFAVAGNWRGDQTVVFDARNGDLRRVLLPGEPSVRAALSPDAAFLLTGSAQEYRVWDTSTFRTLFTVPRPIQTSRLPGIGVFSASGDMVAIMLDFRTIEMRRIPTGMRTAAIRLPYPQAISDLAFSRQGRYLALSTTANRIHVLDLPAARRALEAYGLGPR